MRAVERLSCGPAVSGLVAELFWPSLSESAHADAVKDVIDVNFPYGPIRVETSAWLHWCYQPLTLEKMNETIWISIWSRGRIDSNLISSFASGLDN